MQPHDLLARVVEHLPVGVFAFSGDGRALLWNSCAERLTGWERERVVRDGLTGLPLDAPTARRIRDELLAGRPFRGRIPADVESGATLYFRAEPLPDPDGPILLGVLQEVDDMHAGDEAFALLDALWETAPVGLAFFDSELRFRRVNGAILDIDGGTVDERLGRTLEAVHGPVGAEIAAGLRDVLADGRARFDVPVNGRLWHGRGPQQEWRLYSYPVRSPDDAIVGVGVVVVDVTATARTRREVDALAAERERALTRYQGLVEATSAAVWIREPDGSAVQDAPALRAITGQDVEGYRGWGFLDAVDPTHRDDVRSAWRRAVADGAEAVTCTYRLCTARGYRWFRTRAVPVRVAGVVVEWVGTDTDVDDEVCARQRLAVLARATSAVGAVHEPEEELTALAESVVPEFADICRVYLVDPAPTSAGAVTGKRSVTRTAEGVVPSPSNDERFSFGPAHPVARCVRTRDSVLVPVPVPPEQVFYGPPEQRRWSEEIGINAMLVAPVVSRGVVVAALLFISCGRRPAFTEDDRALVVELAARASAAVEHAEHFQQTRRVSLALQAAMLSAPPTHPGVEVQARYLPAATDLEVGGDWYDAFDLPDGDLAVGVGDVAGHDLSAAATMGQLRSMLRALAYETGDAPSDVVRRLDRVASRLDVTGFTTLLFGRLCRRADRTVFRWANAGHPPPVLVPPDGEPELLRGGVGVVLGVAPDLPRTDREVELPPGATLLLYTDGLFERRNDPDDRASVDLLDLVHRGKELPLSDLCDHLVRGTGADTGDDMVVLALRVHPC
jgi:serine phosphatase RsbU (regulator of sigma subunit)/PAS domain-containing protein